MKRVPQGRYTREFRQEAVKLVMEEKLSLPEAGRRLSLPPSTLGYWVKVYKAGKLGDVGKTYRPLTEVEKELAWAKKELAEVKMERDILKKAAAYFARESLPGTR
jgi:transposase